MPINIWSRGKVDMRRLPRIGSDHFPIRFRLVMTCTETAEVTPELAGDDDVAEIENPVKVESDRSRDPICADWEDES